MHIKRSDNMPGFITPHGETIHELIGHTGGGSQQHSIAQITLRPGKASLKHYHPIAEESYYILAGRGQVLLDETWTDVTAGDTILIPSNVVHQIRNTSQSQESLVFLAVCLPAWTPDNSVYLD
jgi:mannose-6-phosphate isomerase-like protein (cupin superfamily)